MRRTEMYVEEVAGTREVQGRKFRTIYSAWIFPPALRIFSAAVFETAQP